MRTSTSTPTSHCSVAFIGGNLPVTGHRAHIVTFRRRLGIGEISRHRTVRAPNRRPLQCVGSSPVQSSKTTPDDNSINILRDTSLAYIPTETGRNFRLVAADVLILIVLCTGIFCPPLLLSQKSARIRSIVAAAVSSFTSLLYVLRLRSIQRKSQLSLIASNEATSRIEHYFQGERSRIESLVDEDRQRQDELAIEQQQHLEKVFDRSTRQRDAQHAELLRAMRGDMDELQASFDVLRDAAKAQDARRDSDLELRLRDREFDVVRLETRLIDARAAVDGASARESALKAEIESLRAAAADASGLRERLLAAQTRAATLEERVIRTQESALAPPQQQQGQQQIPGGKALRDALLNLGKSFPSAGRLLFDPPADDGPKSSLERRPLPPQDPLNWPDSALGASKPDLGLPKDGGFGMDHFARPPESTDDPFSTLRGAFNEENENAALPGSDGNEERGTEKKLDPVVSGISVEEGETVEGSGATDAYLNSLENNGSNAVVSEDVQVKEPVANISEVEKEEETLDGTIMEEQVKEIPNVAKREEQVIVTPDVEKVEEPVATTAVVTETQEEETSTAGDVKKEEESTWKPAVAGVEARIAKVRDIVKRARRSEKADAERLFSSAVELLQATPGGCMRVDAELGAVLLAWARRDIVADGAKGRLQRAVGLLRTSASEESTEEITRFNLALCLCMLASLETSPRCEQLYEEACTYYDGLEERSRTVCFNAGLAYISRARIADDGDDGEKAKAMYDRAANLFEEALQVAENDAKSKTYLDECRLRLTQLSEGD